MNVEAGRHETELVLKQPRRDGEALELIETRCRRNRARTSAQTTAFPGGVASTTRTCAVSASAQPGGSLAIVREFPNSLGSSVPSAGRFSVGRLASSARPAPLRPWGFHRDR